MSKNSSNSTGNGTKSKAKDVKPTVIMTMTSTFGTLQPFDCASDDFEAWVETYESYLIANGLDASDSTQTNRCAAIFFSQVGLKTYSVLKNLSAPLSPKDVPLATNIKTLNNYFRPAPKALAERYRFMGRKQKPGESVTQFIAELRTLARYCAFKDLDERLRDQFLFGLASEQAQKTLFTKKDDIALKEVISHAIAQETAEASTSLIRRPESNQHHDASSVNKASRNFQKKGKSQQQQHEKGGGSKSNCCPNCGSKKHLTAKDCPHKEAECHNCGKKGHFARMCRKAKKNADTKAVDLNNVIRDIRNVDSDIHQTKKIIKINVTVGNKSHEMELDTGCETSILSEDFWKQLGSPKLKKSSFVFRTYTKAVFKPLGEFETTLAYNGQRLDHSIPVYKGTSLFGRDLLKHFKIDWSDVQRQCNSVSAPVNTTCESLISEFKDVFTTPTSADKIKNFKARITLKDDAQPKFLKARSLPYAIREKVDKELQAMEEAGVIEKIDHSEWASPLVVVSKPNGKVRITGDFKNTVNNQLCITQYPIAVPDDLFNTVSGGDKFSKLDGSNAYHQIELEETCKKFLVINTHRGLYRYNVLPQGIASSPAIFQEFMDRMLHGIPQTGPYMDDVVSTAKDDPGHLQTLRKIFKRMREYNFKLSIEKCEFMKPSIEFLGHRLSNNGIQTTNTKVQSIVNMKAPYDVTSVKSFLGLVTFYGKFVRNLSDVCEPLYKLTRQDEEFKWTKKCQAAFDEVKKKLSTSPVLAHFNPSIPIGIACDASSKGVGVVLYHKYDDGTERPIAYASKLLSATEQRWSQIEKEGFSIIYGIKKFYKFLCGRHFILITDHKPLLKIFGPKSQLPTYVATRLHHWSLFLSEFQYTVEYRQSQQHGNADALSRLPLENCSDDTVDIENSVNQIVADNLEALPVTASAIKKASAKDKVLSRVLHFTKSGWPLHLTDDDKHLQQYHSRREELTFVHDILMWGIRVIIPAGLRKQFLAQLHESHIGIVRMKSLARQHVWWPGIDADIEDMCKSCLHCQHNSPNPRSAPLHPWQFPERAWQRIHMDLAGPFHNKMWLIIMDAHSKWPEVFNMQSNTTTANVLSKLREVISRFGLPEQIVTDNGRQFVSEDFIKFCKVNGITHSRSSVYHPRSNGEAERFVQTFKRGMKAADHDVDQCLMRFLLTYRITPHSTTGSSPAELLQGRKLRTALDLVRPDPKEKVGQAQARQEKSYNHGVKLRQLQPQQPVWVKTYSKNEEKWSHGTIIKALGPVTYLVRVGKAEMKRHIDQIREFHVTPTMPVPVDLDDPVPIISTPPSSSGNTPRGSSTMPSPAASAAVVDPPPGSPPQQAVSPPRPPPVHVPEASPRSSRPTRIRRPVERYGI